MLYTSPIVYKKLVFSPNFSTTLRHPRSGPEKYRVRDQIFRYIWSPQIKFHGGPFESYYTIYAVNIVQSY